MGPQGILELLVSAPHRMSWTRIVRLPRALLGHKAGGSFGGSPPSAGGPRGSREATQRAEALRQRRNGVRGGHDRDPGDSSAFSSSAKPPASLSLRPTSAGGPEHCPAAFGPPKEAGRMRGRERDRTAAAGPGRASLGPSELLFFSLGGCSRPSWKGAGDCDPLGSPGCSVAFRSVVPSPFGFRTASSRLTPGFAFSPQPWISPSTASKSWSS